MAEKVKKKVNQDLLKRQTKIVLFSCYYAGGMVFAIFLLTYFVLGITEYLPYILIFYSVTVVGNGIVYPLHKKPFYTYLIIMISSFFTITGIAGITGGLQSHFLVLLTVLPFSAFITSRRQGTYWLVITIFSLISMYFLNLLGIKFINLLPDKFLNIFAVICTLFSITIIGFISKIMTKTSFKAYEMKQQVEVKNVLINHKNEQIVDSLNYAKKIQQAVLPPYNYLAKVFPENFIYFNPKDIVSGDFYWCHHNKEANKVIWAAVDCTGHGVPGAFMSMIGVSLLNQIVIEHKTDNVAEILDELDKALVKSLNQIDSETTKDSMDMGICCLNLTTNELEFAGAHNPMYLVRDKEIKIYKSTKRCIGYYISDRKPFQRHKIQAQKGDCIYLFSDGYVDQKGGDRKKKFYYKPFRDLLVKNSHYSMSRQRNKLSINIKNWMKSVPQMDDMLVFGVKI